MHIYGCPGQDWLRRVPSCPYLPRECRPDPRLHALITENESL
jgi:hypothetical protein